jgi:hypothetical protein
MRPGELIFFFQRRVIYGIGTVVSIDTEAGSHCVLCNFPG